MADLRYSEKQSIKDSMKFLKKYGSTCKHLKWPEFYVTHKVQKTDTLQGLALKYNTTTEQIRRINRLFTSDSLFLRDHLKIPVARELANSFDINDSNFETSSNVMIPSKSSDSFKNEGDDEDEKSVNDLFGKIDNSIASTRALVKQVEAQSSFLNSSMSGRLSENNINQSYQLCTSSISSNHDLFTTPHPVVLNRGRKVKNSLQRLEKEQDEFFEL